MTNTIANPPSPTIVVFPGSQLAAVATLDMAAHCGPTDYPIVLRAIAAALFTPVFLPIGKQAFTLITHDKATSKNNALLDTERLNALRAEFTTSSSRPIRTQATTLLIYSNDSNDQTPVFANSVRISTGHNFFPDDPFTISICVRSASPTAWDDLAHIRNIVSAAMGKTLCYTTLGYGFACHVDHVMQVSQQMAGLSMRFLGVDLNDPFGSFTAAMPYGLRTINYQVSIPEYPLATLAEPQRTALLNGASQENGIWHWQAGTQPALCDCNAINDHPHIAAYAKLDRQLGEFIYSPTVSWMPDWDELVFDRWSHRWEKFQSKWELE